MRFGKRKEVNFFLLPSAFTTFVTDMEWIENFLFTHSAVQAVVVLSLVIFTGLALGRIRVAGISLGITFVFFVGILAGYAGFSIDGQMLRYAESFGLVLFVYALGLQVGPGFFSSFHHGGVRMNIVGLILIVVGSLAAVGMSLVSGYSMADMTGVLCGATTNTPALAAAQQTLIQLGLPADTAALGCAVAYPLGVVGVIFAVIVLRKFFVRPVDLEEREEDHSEHTFIATFVIKNPGIFHHTIGDVQHTSAVRFVISRLWRGKELVLPTSDILLEEGDRILVITTEKDIETLTFLFGEREDRDWNHHVNWNKLDRGFVSRHVIVSRPEINGKRLGQLQLRGSFGVNVSRVLRSGVMLLATPDLVLQMGDRLTVVGGSSDIESVEKLIGNRAGSLKEPNLAVIFVGIFLGLALGSIPIYLPSTNVPVTLGLAGGPIVAGLLMGRYGPRFHMVTYTTRSANLMLRGIGLSMYLACLGLDAGANFFDTLVGPQGLVWISLGFLLTFVPVVLIGVMAMRWFEFKFGETCGLLCGSMANPMALNYVNDTVKGDAPSLGYATVYPLGMFVRVIIAQLLILLFC